MNNLRRTLEQRIRSSLKKGSSWSEGIGRWIGQKTFSTTDRMTLYEDLAFLLENNQKTEDAIKKKNKCVHAHVHFIEPYNVLR